MREKRDEIIILRTTKAEKSRIYEKMLGMGIRSLSAYIRKMALDEKKDEAEPVRPFKSYLDKDGDAR